MNIMLMACLFACIAFSSVQSASFYYRNGREVFIPIENALIRDEIVSELHKEAVEVAAVDSNPIVENIVSEEILIPVSELQKAADEVAAVNANPIVENIVNQEILVPVSELHKEAVEVAAVKANPTVENIVSDEIPVPVEAVLLAEPVVEFQEPTVIAATEVIVPVISALRSAAPEVVVADERIAAVSNVAVESVAAKETVPATRVTIILENAVTPAQIAAETVAEKEASPSVEGITGKAVVPNDSAIPAVIVANDDFERQSGGAAIPARPTLIQAAQNTLTNLLTNNPITNAFQAIRNPQSGTVTPVVAGAVNAAADEKPDSETHAAPAAPAAPAAATSRPSLIQQFQNNVQQFQSQVQSTIQGITGGTASNTGENRPGLFTQIQQTLNQAINRPLAIFRPIQQDAVTEQKESIDSVVTPVADAIVPIVNEKIELVDDKIDASKKSE